MHAFTDVLSSLFIFTRRAAFGWLLLLSAGMLGALPFASSAGDAKPLQIGMAHSFFTSRPKSFGEIAMDDFKDVMKKTTGLDGELSSKYDYAEVAEKLHAKRLDFGIFHSLEFAWMQKKYPDLQPLLLAVNKYKEERAYVIVNKNGPAQTFADLRGKKLDMPVGNHYNSRVFLEKLCRDTDSKGPSEFFGSTNKSASPEAALDEVARSKVQATVIDTVALEQYKSIKEPVFEKNLKILTRSELFAPAVLVSRKSLDEATVTKFRDGILKAHTIEAGRDMMNSWKVQTFEQIPKDYAQSLEEMLKAYPIPLPVP